MPEKAVSAQQYETVNEHWFSGMIGSTASEVDAAITGWGIQQKQKQSKQIRIPIF
jgi:hypothetical protein